MMLSANSILTIGPHYRPPRGGMAQVMSYYDEYVYDDFQFIANSCDGNRMKKLWCVIVAMMQLVWRMIFSSGIKIVHIHTASRRSYHRSLLFARIAKFFGRKVVMHIHGGGFRDYYNDDTTYVDKSRKYIDAFVALSPSWKEIFEHELHFSNVHVVNNVVPPPTILSIPDDGKVHFLFLGLITEEKGIFDLLEVLAYNRYIFEHQTVFHIAGNGDVEKLRMLIKDHVLSDLVTYEGWVAGDGKLQLLNQCGVFVLPSYVEGLPLSILEAMSYGMRVVSTNVGAIPSIVHVGRNGFLVTPGDKPALLEVLQKVMKEAIDNRHCEYSIEIASNYFPKAVADQLDRVYSSI